MMNKKKYLNRDQYIFVPVALEFYVLVFDKFIQCLKYSTLTTTGWLMDWMTKTKNKSLCTSPPVFKNTCVVLIRTPCSQIQLVFYHCTNTVWQQRDTLTQTWHSIDTRCNEHKVTTNVNTGVSTCSKFTEGMIWVASGLLQLKQPPGIIHQVLLMLRVHSIHLTILTALIKEWAQEELGKPTESTRWWLV